MTARISDELRDAIQQSRGRPIELLDDETQTSYILLPRSQFENLVYDDSELDESEMMAAASAESDDPEGWGADGIDEYVLNRAGKSE